MRGFIGLDKFWEEKRTFLFQSEHLWEFWGFLLEGDEDWFDVGGGFLLEKQTSWIMKLSNWIIR